jgi:hypothetical protein
MLEYYEQFMPISFILKNHQFILGKRFTPCYIPVFTLYSHTSEIIYNMHYATQYGLLKTLPTLQVIMSLLLIHANKRYAHLLQQ